MNTTTTKPKRPRLGGLWKRVPAGTVAVRRGKITNHRPRRWIKVRIDGPPKDRWRILATVIWELAHGPAPKGFKVCHRDGDLINDDLPNLILLSNADAVRHFMAVNPDMKDNLRRGVARGNKKRWETYHLVKNAVSHRIPVQPVPELKPAPSEARGKAHARLSEFLQQLEMVA